MDTIYNPKEFEKKIYFFWENNGYFKCTTDKFKKNFSIMVPPPNITGSLHMGHALQYIIIDIITRYQRMLGKNILCQIGTDHAGIATQSMIEKNFFVKNNKAQYKYDKKIFLNEVWKWKKKCCDVIFNQMRRLGLSADWNRKRFTMDDKFSKTVKNIFISLYKEGLIYKKKRLTHWDLKLRTAISDLEVEHKKLNTYVWYIRYSLEKNITTLTGKNYLVISTTRPETLLADTAIAINPLDKRYSNLIGKFVIVPLINRKIPIIIDNHADINKGTGCVKISPAHNFDDYQVAIRHNLPLINIFNNHGNILNKYQIYDIYGKKIKIYSENIPDIFQNLHYTKVRKIIINMIKNDGLLELYEQKLILVPYSSRSNTIIQPMLTSQWYLNIKKLAKTAINAVKKKQIKFFPQIYENMFYSWMENIQDWCISRQLWWGHQIPIWYDINKKIYVGKNEKEIRNTYNLKKDVFIKQDKNVLDTWFSSSLWTFVTLDWPNYTKEFSMFHPTNVIVSGFDIIFFWISRMIMMTMHFVKNKDNTSQIPFKNILMTGLIRDEKGEKMSKSKGNVIDPIDIIDGISFTDLLKKRLINITEEKYIQLIKNHTKKHFLNGSKSYGTDALRFTLAALSSTGRDIYWDMSRLDGYRNFCNKLWNASILILKNIKYKYINNKEKLSITDKWIISEYNIVIKLYTNALNKYRFDQATNILYNFIWNKFCDWYLEYAKIIFKNKIQIQYMSIHYTLYNIFESLLKLAHPIIPFLTEVIWQKIKKNKKKYSDSIMIQSFPKFNKTEIDNKAASFFKILMKIITVVRKIKIDIYIKTNKKINLYLKNKNQEIFLYLKNNVYLLQNFLNINQIFFILQKELFPKMSFIEKIDDIELSIPIDNALIDKDYVLVKINKRLKHNKQSIDYLNNLISNKNFLKNAPKNVIENNIQKLKKYKKIEIELIKKRELIKII
ncbi:valine--tRNA ligase [Enterobacteriaceae endosymbiont of Plateumaris consimilis]|uniref:valine--tRNA ligase n=1 Tax=Enterobacteriaceae endosymbiont of Plateumaris consimilis TaxID=2675794 RepID=UPI00144940FB|nr:valine--tRNA ligase [Enterobacteriaceae endosymbiont of Plateumaris consimilis]QJC28563.1 valine--tRNA ligase [Enterobacteriaceae endosymbiont of Plateumaris consimilis]